MAWIPLQESGLAFEFNGDEAAMTNSVITPLSPTAGSWLLSGITAPANIRITVQSYTASTESLFSNQAMFTWGLSGSQTNTTLNGTAFTPGQLLTPITQDDIDGAVALIQYQRASADEGDMEESYAFLIEVEGADTCQELGRVTRSYVSGYDRSRVHVARIRRQERRCVVANFNGAIPPGRSIVSVTWRCVQPWVAKMSNAAVQPREATVLVDFQNPGFGAIKATVQLDNGEIYNQIFEFTVLDAPYFLEGTPVQGPYLLTASA